MIEEYTRRLSPRVYLYREPIWRPETATTSECLMAGMRGILLAQNEIPRANNSDCMSLSHVRKDVAFRLPAITIGHAQNGRLCAARSRPHVRVPAKRRCETAIRRLNDPERPNPRFCRYRDARDRRTSQLQTLLRDGAHSGREPKLLESTPFKPKQKNKKKARTGRNGAAECVVRNTLH